MSEQNDDIEQLSDDLDDQNTADNQEHGHILAKFYEDAKARVRVVSYKGELWYSVVDVIGLLTDAKIPRNYWSDLKRRLSQEEGFSELHAKIVQLQMMATDGKMRLTDAANEETLLRIV